MGSVQDLQQRAMEPGDHRFSVPLAQKPGDIGWQEVVRGNDHIGLAGSFPQAGQRCGANHLAVAAVSCRFQRVRERIGNGVHSSRFEIFLQQQNAAVRVGRQHRKDHTMGHRAGWKGECVTVHQIR